MDTSPTDPGLSPEERTKLLTCLKSRRWRLNNLYKIKDKAGNVIPFRLNATQTLLDASVHNRQLTLKSRQHGITTYWCIRALDTCLFRSNTKAGIVAHKKEDAEAFFRDKIMFAYNNLPGWLKAIRPIRRKDNTGELEFENGSQIVVSVSHRGGTLQLLHVSEYGPMCSMFPDRAQEVKSGAIPAASDPESIVSIESTAYGAFGDFYTLASESMSMDRQVRAGTAHLTPLDFAFQFFAWWQDPINTIDPTGVDIPSELADYFTDVEAKTGTRLLPPQRAWYAKTAKVQSDKMKREHPSFPDEAFHQAIEGSIYGRLIAAMEVGGRIVDLPILPGIPVNTFWDIGRNDSTCILFHQQVGPWHHFIDFYENHLEQVAHYARVLRERGYLYGRHYLPHDGAVTEWAGSGNETRLQKLQRLIDGTVVKVERITEIGEGIEMVRSALPLARFDKVRCGENPPGSGRGLIPALRAYRYQWNEKVSAFHDVPLHDWASNPADSVRTWAEGYPMEGINDETSTAARRGRKANRSWKSS